jgi:DNA-binding transcriptional ArsR family regulator
MNPDYATVAKCLASPARSAMVGRLLDGRAMTAGELASAARVLPSTASEHLAQLVAAGLVTSMHQGRRRYFSLATIETAEALEALAHICPRQSARSLAGVREDTALSMARLCYDHLAGKVGVAILDALLSAKWLQPSDEGFVASAKGTEGFRHVGIEVDLVRSGRRPLARACLDWTERRPHLAGALGASVATALLDQKWLERRPQGRGLRITPTGSAQLKEVFGARVPKTST